MGDVLFKYQTTPTSDPIYRVYLNEGGKAGDRVGFVRKTERGRWAAVDTYLVPAGNSHKTRAAAVKAIIRRFQKGGEA